MGRETLYPLTLGERFSKQTIWHFKRGWNKTVLNRLCEIGKKNGKSELGAAIALYMLLADGEPNAEVYVAACDRQQASIIFNTSMNFVGRK